MSIYNLRYPPQTYYINSFDRISGDHTNFNCAKLELNNQPYTHCCVKQVGIPKVFPNIPTNYNTFTLIEKGVSRTITLEVGYYNKNTMIAELPALLNQASVLNGNNWVYTITYRSALAVQNFKYTFSVSGNGGFQPSFSFTEDQIYLQLGFDVGTHVFIGSSLVSDNIINFNPTSKLYIKSDLVSSSNESVLQEVLQVDTIGFGSYIFYQNQGNLDLESKKIVGDQKDSFNIQLVNENNQLVDLQGQDWSFSIIFYVRQDTQELIREDLKIKTFERLYRNEEQKLQDIIPTKIEPETISDAVDITTRL
jgi:hypothetical protein